MAAKARKTPANYAPTFRKTMGVNVAKLAHTSDMTQNTNPNADLIDGGSKGFDIPFARVVAHYDHHGYDPKPVRFDPNDPNIKA